MISLVWSKNQCLTVLQAGELGRIVTECPPPDAIQSQLTKRFKSSS